MRQQQLIYDISLMDYPIVRHCGLVAGLALAVAVVVAWSYRRGGGWKSAAGIGGFVVLCMVLVEMSPWWEHRRLLQALQSGQVKTTQGELSGYWNREAVLADSQGKPAQKLVWENFTVGGVLFGYYRDHAQPGFRNADTPPVELVEGLPLRISYLEDTPGDVSQRRILRLEIAESLQARR